MPTAVAFEVRGRKGRAVSNSPLYDDGAAAVVGGGGGQLAQSLLLTQSHPHRPSPDRGGRARLLTPLITWRGGAAGGGGALVRRPAIGALSGAHRTRRHLLRARFTASSVGSTRPLTSSLITRVINIYCNSLRLLSNRNNGRIKLFSELAPAGQEVDFSHVICRLKL